MRRRRALLFLPGDSERKIAKAITLEVDAVILDLEDGVALGQKEMARALVRRALETFDFGPRERIVRLNAVGSGLEDADLAATLPGRPDAYLLPKVSDPAAIAWLDAALTAAEAHYGWPPGGIRILALIETALGVVNLREIARVGGRLEALLFGAEDLIGDIGGVRTAAGHEVLYARSAVVTTAAAFGLAAIDMVFVALDDLEGLARECREAVELGYQGKMAIHPRQVPIIQAAFTPTTAQVDAARRLIDAYREHERHGVGVFVLDGKMVDAPMLAAARRVLIRAGLNPDIN
ncbi:MAG: CoA ester lyase [Anaerolineae bacterium]|nr:CoA ester lyase [Anaerolineae bacterium]